MTFFPKKGKKVGKLQLFKNRNKNRKHECWKVKRDVQSGQMCTGRSPWVFASIYIYVGSYVGT